MKKFQILTNIEITDTGSEGQALTKIDEMVVFVSGAVPGDVADIQITNKKRHYAEAKVVHLITPSPNRVSPSCSHFGTCGGCKWQYLDYKWQLYYKQKQVKDALRRIGKIDLPEINPIVPSQEIYFYRNKLEYTFSNKKWLTKEEIGDKSLVFNDLLSQATRNALGFHIPGMFDKVLDIQKCYLQADPSNQIRNTIREYALAHHLEFFDLRNQTGLLRTLMIRTTSTGETMVVVVFYKNEESEIKKLLEHIVIQFPSINSLMYVINSKKNDTIHDLEPFLYKGNPYIVEEMEISGDYSKKLTFKIGAKSFYQTNSLQAFELYKIALDFAQLKGTEIVYDLYTGTGTIANFIAHKAKKVVGVEYVSAAIEDANENAKRNGIENTIFYAGDMKDILNVNFVQQNGIPDVIITDPPRAGMHEDVVKQIISIGPQKIVYVSCNVATQARDIAILSSFYKLTKIQPVDMFPHTHHVENVVLLEKIEQ